MSVKADKRRHSPIRWIFILLFLIVVLIGVILGVSYTKLGKINSTPMNQSKLVTVHEDANMKDYTNIALFGIDSQTGSMSDRGNRSDSIIVVSINNQTKEIKMLSIYRDTYVSVNGHYTKINAADCIHWMGTRPSHIQESAIPQEEILPVPDGSVKFFRRSLPKAKKIHLA